MRTWRWQRKTSLRLVSRQIDHNLALLEVGLAPREGRVLTAKEAARLESARKIAIKCQCLPGAAARNLLIATMKATPQGCTWLVLW